MYDNFIITINIQGAEKYLDKAWGEFSESYNSNIIYSNSENESPKIKIFYDYSEMLLDKMDILIENKLDILKGIQIDDPRPSSGGKLNLSKSKLLKISDDDGYWENGSRYLILELDRIILTEDYNSIHESSTFILTRNALKFIDRDYEFDHFGYDYPNRFEARHLHPFFRYYGMVEFNFQESFSPYGLGKHDAWAVQRIPKLLIRTNITDQQKIIEYADQICLLSSYYYNSSFGYFNGEILGDHSVMTITQRVDETIDGGENGFTLMDKFPNAYDLISSCNSETVSENNTLLTNLISRIILASQLTDEAQFMLFYNIVEKIRNYHIKKQKEIGDPIKIREDFGFIYGKKKTDKIIAEKISEISEFVIEQEREEFKKIANLKVNFVKKTLMNSQFEAFFQFQNIDPIVFDLDMDELLDVRNKIYHGHLIGLDEVNFKTHNKNLRRLIDNLLVEWITK